MLSQRRCCQRLRCRLQQRRQGRRGARRKRRPLWRQCSSHLRGALTWPCTPAVSRPKRLGRRHPRCPRRPPTLPAARRTGRRAPQRAPDPTRLPAPLGRALLLTGPSCPALPRSWRQSSPLCRGDSLTERWSLRRRASRWRCFTGGQWHRSAPQRTQTRSSPASAGLRARVRRQGRGPALLGAAGGPAPALLARRCKGRWRMSALWAPRRTAPKRLLAAWAELLAARVGRGRLQPRLPPRC